MSPNLRGALWIVGSCLAGTIMSIGIKDLADDINTLQITFLRCLVGLLLTIPLVMLRRAREGGNGSNGGAGQGNTKENAQQGNPEGTAQAATLGDSGWRRHISARWRLHVVRGVFAVAAINCGYYAISQIPLATVTVLFFTAPLFITILAVPVLGEKVGWRRWSATCVGFIGAIVVLWPTPGTFEGAMIIAVGSSFLFACALVTGKMLSTTEAPSTMLLYSGVITSIGCLPLAVAVWVPPTPAELFYLTVVSVFATARMYCDIRGYAAGEASFVAPFSYLRLIFMAAAGYFLFSEVPELRAMGGAVIIIGSSLYIAHREATRHRQLSKPAAGPSPD